MSNSDFDLTQQNQNIDRKIVATLERVTHAFRVLLWQESKVHALSPIQVQILIFLRYHDVDKCKVSYLAKEFNITKATISDSVMSLEQKELITKEYLQQDARSYCIILTKRGRQIAEKTSVYTNEARKPIQKMSDDDKEKLLTGLLATIRHLNESGVISIQRMCQTCRFYESDKAKDAHYCNLLKEPLTPVDHRLDCPEHELLV
ncbi:MAG: MarR family winged helix-turn-helix transcriptional regulator [Cyclobacteriaceae bacterium]